MIAIDLGSNSIRILQMDTQTKKITNHFSKTVRTADGLKSTGVISAEAIERIIASINEAKLQGFDFHNDFVKAVSTQALRVAKNQVEVVEAIYKSTGVKFEIIDGETEAQITLNGVKRRMELLNLCMDSFMVLDIGGGSTELIFVFKDVVVTKSFPIGIVTLTQSYSSLDEIRANIAQEMQEVQKFINEVYAKYGKAKLFLATAGTPTSVASMKLGLNFKTYDKDKINGTVLSHKDVDIEFKKLFAMSKVEKIEAVGEGRDDLIGTGMLIYDSIFIFSGMSESIVVDDGLVEGLLLEG